MTKNQLCFNLKIRSGARTPLEIYCEPLSVNENYILNNGFRYSASSIANQVVRTIKRRFGVQNKEQGEAVQTSHNSDYTAALQVEIEAFLCAFGHSVLANDQSHRLAACLNSVVKKQQQNCA